VDKLDRNIKAGAKFMRFMETQYLEREPLDDVTKSLFATASYNAALRNSNLAQGSCRAWIQSQPMVQQRRNLRLSWAGLVAAFVREHDGAYFS
jgi:hypothetical protein